MRTSDMVKSKYWRARDLEGRPPVTLTIAEVTEEIFSRGGKQEVKCFLWFNEGLKGLQLNKTRVRTLEYAYGPDSDLWVGRKVRLSFDPTVMFGDKPVGGVKLETPPNAIYRGSPAAAAVTVPPGAPPPPVWNGREWVTAAPAAAPVQPPPPVWNPTKGQWEFVSPGTGEIHSNGSTAAPPPPAAPAYQPPPTISQRIAAGNASDQAWDKDYQPLAKAGDPDFDDAIPF